MYVHQNEMELLVVERNFQEARVGIELLSSHPETLQSLDQEEFHQFVEQKLKLLYIPDTQQAFIIVNQNKEVLFYTGSQHQLKNLANHTGVAEALAGNTGSIAQEFSNTIHLISYGTIEPLGWAFVVEETWEGGRLSWLNLTFLVPLLLIPVIFIFFVYIWVGNRWVLRPLSILNSYAQRVGNGQYDEKLPFVSGIEEINILHFELERMVNRLRQSRSSLRNYASAIQMGQEDERKRLSQELHDDTIQSLVHLDQQVQLMEMSDASTLALRTQIAKMSSNLRSMIQDLRPSYLDELGLVPAIDMLTKSLNASQPGSVIILDVIGEARRLPSEQELVFYRVAQEGISNGLKHTNSETIYVTLSFGHQSTQLEIQDEGKGIPDGVLNQLESSFGLRGMHERAFSIGGQLELLSTPEGTTVHLQK